MASDKPQAQRKRLPDQPSHERDGRPPTVKGRRREALLGSSGYPPRFWDTLSKVFLTSAGLKEFDRRTEQTASLPTRKPRVIPSTRLLRSDLRRLRQIASEGGPDLNWLRGVSLNRLSFSRGALSSLIHCTVLEFAHHQRQAKLPKPKKAGYFGQVERRYWERIQGPARHDLRSRI